MKKIFAAVAVILLGLSMFASSAWAGYYGGGFRSYSSVRVYSAPRVYAAPRVYVAPRPVYVAPRPVIVTRPAVVVRRPVIVTRPPVVVAPVTHTVVPDADLSSSYGQPAPVAVAPVQHDALDYFYIFLIVLLIVALLGSVSYGFYVYDPFDWWVEDDVVVY